MRRSGKRFNFGRLQDFSNSFKQCNTIFLFSVKLYIMKISEIDIKKSARQFFRFCLVGGIGFIVDAGVLSLLHYGVGVSPIWARLPSASCSVVTTWFFDMYFTFGRQPTSKKRAFMLYTLVKGTGFFLNLAIYGYLIQTIPFFAAYVLLALVVSTGIVLIFNFTLSALIFTKT